MDDEAIIIQIELQNFARTMVQFKKISDAMKGMAKDQKTIKATAGRGSPDLDRMISFNAGAMRRQHAALASAAVTQKMTQKMQSSVASTGGSMAGGAGMGLFGIGGPVGMAVAVTAEIQHLEQQAAGAAQALWRMTQEAAAAGIAFARIGLTAGGTRSESGLLSAYGAAFHVDMAQMAREFANTISQPGVGQGFAGRAGIHHYGTFDTTDTAGKLLAWIDKLRSLSPSEAMRQAYATTTQDLLPMRNVSDKTMDRLHADAAANSVIFGDKFNRGSQEFQVSIDRMTRSMDNFKAAVAVGAMPAIEFATKGINLMASGINVMAVGMMGISDIIQGAFLAFKDPLAGGQQIIKGTQEVFNTSDYIKSENARLAALDRNTRAIDDNTEQYATRNGTFGGGDRARGAVPSKWSGLNTERLTGEAARLGAFQL